MATTTPIQPCAFILNVKIVIPADKAEEFLSHFRPVYDATVTEPECVFFTFGRQMSLPAPGEEPAASNECCFAWSEGWAKSPEWFMSVQMKKDYLVRYLAATEPMFLKPSKSFEGRGL